MMAIVKSLDEWKQIIGNISPKEFEHLCYQLISSMPGFSKIDLIDGSYDHGRDIEAIYRSKAPDGITEISEKWRFECKRYSKGIPFDDVSGKIHQSNLNRVDKIVIMSNMHLTPDCKDEITKVKKSLYCKVIDWTGVHFQDILFQYTDICNYYFPDEDIPVRLSSKKDSKELINSIERTSSNFGPEFTFKLDIPSGSLNNVKEISKKINILFQDPKMDLNIKSFIYHRMSGLLASIRRYEDALFLIEESLSITPQNIPALLNKALFLRELGDLDNSIICYNEILKIDSKNKFALNDKAIIYSKKGEFADALKFVNKALKVDPTSKIAIKNKVNILSNMNKREEANDFLNLELNKNPNSKILLNSKTSLLIDLLDLKEAMTVVDKILSIDPDDIEALNFKGIIYGTNGDHADKDECTILAEQWFDKAINKDDADTAAWSNKITCLIDTDIEEAKRLNKELIRKFPKDRYILSKMAEIYFLTGDKRRSLKYINKSLKHGFSRKNYIIKGRILLSMRKNRETINLMDKILEYDISVEEAWSLKGMALGRMRQNHKADICFQNSKKYESNPISLLTPI